VVDVLGNGRFLVNGRLAYAARDGGRTWVFIDGRTYVVEPESRDASERLHVTDDQVALSAPMPATVLAIKVAPGQEVAAGDQGAARGTREVTRLPRRRARATRHAAIRARVEHELIAIESCSAPTTSRVTMLSSSLRNHNDGNHMGHSSPGSQVDGAGSP